MGRSGSSLWMCRIMSRAAMESIPTSMKTMDSNLAWCLGGRSPSSSHASLRLRLSAGDSTAAVAADCSLAISGFSRPAFAIAAFASACSPSNSSAQDFRYQAFGSFLSMATAKVADLKATRPSFNFKAAAALFLYRSHRSLACGPVKDGGARANSLRPCQKWKKARSNCSSANAATPSFLSWRPACSMGAAVSSFQGSAEPAAGKGSNNFQVHFSAGFAFSRSPLSNSARSASTSLSNNSSPNPSRNGLPFSIASMPAS
mmetsp:Transcript_66583/g.191416  ORF Transcript_66583/g.191416 Transcript_66583/m.191416 type:complete len:259 (-) Transcript_66583:302-1078(-)